MPPAQRSGDSFLRKEKLIGLLKSLRHDFTLPYDLVEAYRSADAADGAAFLVADGDSWVISASYGLQHPGQAFRLKSLAEPIIIGSAQASLVIPVSPPHALLALFGDYAATQAIDAEIAAKGASWAAFNGERLSGSLPPMLDPSSFPAIVAGESQSRNLNGVSLVTLDISPLLAYVAENVPSAHTDRVQTDFFRLLSHATRETGLVFRAPCGRALIVHFSRRPSDPELIGEQMHKILRRAIGAPAVLDSVCESSLSLETTDRGALGVLEAFAAGL